jgi:hypothetical protein
LCFKMGIYQLFGQSSGLLDLNSRVSQVGLHFP